MKNSEILFKILEKLSTVEKLVKLNDFQQKLIIKRLNEIDSKEKVEVVALPTGPGKVTAEPLPDVQQKNMEERKNNLMTITKDKEYNFDVISNEDINDGLNSNENLPKFPIIQQLSYNGKLVNKAEITIKNIKGEVIKKPTINSSSGRWQAMLPLGKYVVDVNGKSGKDVISYSQSFDVKQTSSPILLPMPEMYKVNVK